MSAFFLFDNLEVTDPAKLEAYKAGVAPIVEKFGGRYRAVGGETTVLEGNWQPSYPVLIEFPDLAQARAWYDSAEYAGFKALRQSAVRNNGVLIAGL